MASAYFIEKDGQWVADFRPLGGRDKQRRRMRLDPAKFKKQEAAAAFAYECERYCRLLESDARDPRDIEHAARIGAITEDQADRLRRDLPAGPATRDPGPLTLKEAAAMHPATQREARREPVRAINYFDYLEEFRIFAKVNSIFDVTVQQVVAWIDHLEGEGYSWHARRHRLMYLRRACRMAQTQGLPDPISGLKLDRRSVDEPAIQVYTLPELAAFLRTDDKRVRLAVALGGFMGLRPSEIFRAQPEDLHKGILTIGKRKAKNRASKRSLPVPSIIVGWWNELAETCEAGTPIVLSRHHAGAHPFKPSGFSNWMGRLETPIMAKRLRKSFATWASREIPGRDVERFMGHQSAFLAAVTSNFYTGESFAIELKPSAKKIDAILRRCYAQLLQSHKSLPRRRLA